jgi:hypothetical protein
MVNHDVKCALHMAVGLWQDCNQWKEFSRTKDAFPWARLALLMLTIHCGKSPSCDILPAGCMVGPGM